MGTPLAIVHVRNARRRGAAAQALFLGKMLLQPTAGGVARVRFASTGVGFDTISLAVDHLLSGGARSVELSFEKRVDPRNLRALELECHDRPVRIADETAKSEALLHVGLFADDLSHSWLTELGDAAMLLLGPERSWPRPKTWRAVFGPAAMLSQVLCRNGKREPRNVVGDPLSALRQAHAPI